MGVFWGFVLVVFDFRVCGWNLLPDFVGFVLIAVGLGDLEGVHRNFGKAQGWALALVVLALPDVVELGVPVQPGNPTILVNVLWPLVLLMNGGRVIMTWFILKGVVDLAQKAGLLFFAQETSNILSFYVGVEVFGLAFAVIFHLFGAWLLTLLIFGALFFALVFTPVIISFILSLLVFNIYYRASKELEF